MENDFRGRIMQPLLMFLGLVGGIGLFAFSISRVLLTVPEMVATFTALLVATYVLGIAVLITAKPKISSRVLGAGMVIGFVAVIGAGSVAAQTGMRDVHGEETAVAGEADGEEEEAVAEDAALFVAVDNEFTEAPETLPAGGAEVALENQGNLEHNVLVDDTGDIVEAAGGATETGTFDLEPGTYRYHCDIPGHEATMNGEFTVE